jgi:hypothetical protein
MQNNHNRAVSQPDYSNKNKPRISFFRGVRDISRLAIGGISIGIDNLQNRLNKWEDQAAISPSDQRMLKTHADRYPLPQSSTQIIPANDTVDDTNLDLVRYALIGLIFESQYQVQSSYKTFKKVGKLSGRLSSPFLNTLESTKVLSPARSRYNRLVSRGEQEVNRWITLGRSEHIRSRQMAEIAFDDTLESSVQYLAESPDIQDLVQSQGIGLASEVVDEVRERTISADTVLEGVFRAILRRKPRSELPPPPEVVQESAIPLGDQRKKQSE